MSLTWRLIKQPLKKILAAQFDIVGKNFRRAISETQNQLISTLQETSVTINGNPAMLELDVYRSDDIVGNAHTYRKFLHVCALPVTEFSNSDDLKKKFAKKIIEEGVVLNSLKNGGAYSENEWETIIQGYVNELFSNFLPYVFKEMAKNAQILTVEYSVLAFEKKEAVRVRSVVTEYPNLVILYRQRDFQNERILSVRNARKMWGRRNDKGYVYK